jgi:hypothetical protein
MTSAWSSGPTNGQQRRDWRISDEQAQAEDHHVARRLRRRSRAEQGHPLAIGGEQLHEWLVPLKAFRESHGEEGGEVNASTPGQGAGFGTVREVPIGDPFKRLYELRP